MLVPPPPSTLGSPRARQGQGAPLMRPDCPSRGGTAASASPSRRLSYTPLWSLTHGRCRAPRQLPNPSSSTFASPRVPPHPACARGAGICIPVGLTHAAPLRPGPPQPTSYPAGLLASCSPVASPPGTAARPRLPRLVPHPASASCHPGSLVATHPVDLAFGLPSRVWACAPRRSC